MAIGAPTQQKMDFFLIGKTGNGKSSTGNTILGREEFETRDSGDSATLNTSVEWTDINGTLVGVVDGPGVMDTKKKKGTKKTDLCEKLSSGFVHCPDGFHALLLVLKYGNRYTEEEIKTVNILRVIFGPNFIKNHCVLIFTYGDDFKRKYKGKEEQQAKTFPEWLKDQKGDLKKLITECQQRAVLFDNFDHTDRDKTLASLFSAVQGIRNHYTHEIFENVKRERTVLIEKFESIQLKDHIQRDISLLNAMLNPMNGAPLMHVLEPLLDRLEDALNKENGDLQVVNSLKAGITKARCGKYDEAYQTIQTVKSEGKNALTRFWKVVQKFFMRFLDRVI